MLSYCYSHPPTLVPSFSTQFSALNHRPVSSSLSARNSKILQPNSKLQKTKWSISCSSQEGSSPANPKFDGVENLLPDQPLKPEPELDSSPNPKKGWRLKFEQAVDMLRDVLSLVFYEQWARVMLIQVVTISVCTFVFIKDWRSGLNNTDPFLRILAFLGFLFLNLAFVTL